MDSSAPFIPLSRALQIIAAQVPAVRHDTNALACTVSALVPLFTLEGGQTRPLREAELRGALFMAAGDSVTFADGRAPIAGLAVTSDAVARVIRVLDGAALQVESLHG